MKYQMKLWEQKKGKPGVIWAVKIDSKAKS